MKTTNTTELNFCLGDASCDCPDCDPRGVQGDAMGGIGATIERAKLYRRGAVGPAWVWLYTVTVTDGPNRGRYSGQGLDWARSLAKRKAPAGSDIVETWKC